MQRASVSMHSVSANGRPHVDWFVFETDHRSFDHMVEALKRDGIVSGYRVNIDGTGDKKVKRERDRYPAAVGTSGLMLMQECSFELLPPLLAAPTVSA